jgi:clan AA aspartic protease (TIGR02281 family)
MTLATVFQRHFTGSGIVVQLRQGPVFSQTALNQKKYPDEVLSDPTLREPILKIVGRQSFKDFRQSLSVTSPLKIIGSRYVIGSGCRPHFCCGDGGVFVLDTLQKTAWALRFDNANCRPGGGKVQMWGTLSADDVVPKRELDEWLTRGQLSWNQVHVAAPPSPAPPSGQSQSQSNTECIVAGKTVTGLLAIEQRTHPNGTPLKAYVLRLPVAKCAVDAFFTHLRGSPNYSVREIHLVSSGSQSEPLANLVGQTITVRLDDVFPAGTAWHFGNAVSDKYSIVSASPDARASPFNTAGGMEVAMVRSGGTYAVPVLINGAITLNFVLDSGASDVSIPSDVFGTLVRTGTVTERDIIGSETYTLADGSRKKATTFNIRSLKVGSALIENVKGSVAEDAGPLLSGMSFLSRFPSWSVDNGRHVLILK